MVSMEMRGNALACFGNTRQLFEELKMHRRSKKKVADSNCKDVSAPSQLFVY